MTTPQQRPPRPAARSGGWRRLKARLFRTPPVRVLAGIVRGKLRPALRGINGIRLAASSRWLPQGRGLEIGAGPNPQPLPEGCECRYFDLRTADELRQLFGDQGGALVPVRPIAEVGADFPDGADFLIAHNVLEHCADPIGTLIEWHRLLRPGGTIVISLPDMHSCPDRLRRVATLEHLLLDHLLDRDENSFESLEHVFSFVSGWNDEGFFAGKPKDEVARLAHWCVTEESAKDCHWHAFDEALGRELIEAATVLDGRSATFVNVASPLQSGDRKTLGDLIYVYRLAARDPREPGPAVTGRFAAVAASLDKAHQRLRSVLGSTSA